MVPVTRDVAMHHFGLLYHVRYKNADGSAARCRTNGLCKTWKTRPQDFCLPVKHGLRECFYITETNCVDWEITEEDWEHVRRRLLCVHLGVQFHIPDDFLYDLALERGVNELTASEICRR